MASHAKFKKGSDRVVIQTFIPSDTRKQLMGRAHREGRSMGGQIRYLIAKDLEQEVKS